MFGLGTHVPEVEAQEVLQAIDNPRVVILDVRTAGEVEKGKIKGSLHIPLDSLPDKVSSVIPDKTKVIYAYCLSGSRSTQAVGILIDMGYTNAKSMKSGLLSWRSQNYPLEN